MKAAMLAAMAMLAAAAVGARADAEAPLAATARGAAPVQICTTTTTVVRRGDVVVSNTSATRYEAARGGSAAHAVFSAPGAAVKSVLGFGILAGGGDGATASNIRGEWLVADVQTGGVCHLSLTSQAAAAGFQARSTGCAPPMSRVEAWTFDNGEVLLHGGGDFVLRLAGTRDRMAGVTDTGGRFELMR